MTLPSRSALTAYFGVGAVVRMLSFAAAMSAGVGLSSSCSTQPSSNTHRGRAARRPAHSLRMRGFLTKAGGICNARPPGRATTSGVPIDLRGPDVALPMPADVLARQVEQDLLPGGAAIDRAFDPFEHDLARVGRMKQEGPTEDDGVAVPQQARLEQIARCHAERLAALAHREAPAADQILDVQRL